MGRRTKHQEAMAEAVKVVVRCRPMNKREIDMKCLPVINIDERIGQCLIKNPTEKKAPPKTFTFDGAYGVDSTTEQIYADIGYALVEGVTEGYNGTIFAYGQTGCGKSFSMQGIPDPATQRGIIPRAFDHMFETIHVTQSTRFLVHASYLEIYNEEVRDLLGKDIKRKLDLKEHPDKGVYVQDLSMHACSGASDCERVMQRGWNNRATGSTMMNSESSRSHSIFTIFMERCDQDDKGEEHIRAAKLNLVDLAGSERQAKTGATGDRLKEATKINLSLSALGNVISALVDGKAKHIPYRDSKLTRLLQDSLGGNTKTLMVACLSPASDNYDETLSTLRYANRAKNIKNKPKINEDPKDALLREYHSEIQRLKAMLLGQIPVDLDAVEGGMAAGAAPPKSGGQPHAQKRRAEKSEANDEEAMRKISQLQQEYQEKLEDMEERCAMVETDNQKLQEERDKLREYYDSQIESVQTSHVLSPGQTMNEDVEEVALANQPPDREEEGMYVDDDLDDAEYMQTQEGQTAVHLGTTIVEMKGGTAPRGSPTGNLDHSVSLPPEQALRRLHQLEQQMVGGEEANNQTIKERRLKKKKHTEDYNKRLKKALEEQSGEDIILGIYDNVHEELTVKTKLFKKEEEKTQSLKQEIDDLQKEFEFDREDYLDTIRKQEKETKFWKAVAERMQPCLRRESNYYNLDKVRYDATWDEEQQDWQLPGMKIEKLTLPSTGSRVDQPRGAHMNGDDYEARMSEDKYRQHLQRTDKDHAKNYFKSKRTEKLLNQTQDVKAGRNHGNRSPSNLGVDSNSGPPSANSSLAWQREPMQNTQQSYGQINGDDMPLRKPTRLDPVSLQSGKARKKKNRYSGLEPM